MASIDLSSYSGLYVAVFVRLEIPNYSTLRFSTHYKDYSIREIDNVNYTYTGLSGLLGVSDAEMAIRTNTNEMTVTISGIPSSSVSEIIDNETKGSLIEVRRAYFNKDTYQIIGAPVIKFKGIVNTYNINEEWSEDPSSAGTYSVGLLCSNLTDLLENKRAGRRTNPLDQKTYFPNDLSMDRVPTITGSKFNFGATR
jgi:hypothetical protein